MPTDDFVNDALDSLNQDPDLYYLFVGYHGGKFIHYGSRCLKREQLDRLTEGAARLLGTIDLNLKKKNQ